VPGDQQHRAVLARDVRIGGHRDLLRELGSFLKCLGQDEHGVVAGLLDERSLARGET
jgi:hypothetical protein